MFNSKKLKYPLIMGILNVTPDSFSDGGRYMESAAALRQITAMVEAGAAIIDIGAESTRPGAAALSAAEEERRLRPLLEALPKKRDYLLSIDTYKPEIARLALDFGADIINDIHGIDVNKEMAELIVDKGAGWVIMDYKPLKSREEALLRMGEATKKALNLGLLAEKLIIDLGLGFNKNEADNLALTAAIPLYKKLGFPLLYGPSRKRFLGELSGEKEPAGRDGPTALICALAATLGADILRVHNVPLVREALRLTTEKKT